MPAEPSLINYAHQLAEDIPSSNVIKTDVMKKNSRQSKKNKLANKGETGIDLVLNVARSQDKQAGWTKNFPIEKSTLSDSYEKTIGIFGRFKQEMVSFNSVLATNSQQNV